LRPRGHHQRLFSYCPPQPLPPAASPPFDPSLSAAINML
jgi:hypothetical protein